jgi:hypothetical protein
MEEFVSEPITPHAGTFDAAAMATGVPGLPTGFAWRGESFTVVERLESWKFSAREGGRAGGELYLRRHCFRLRMSDGAIWTVYFVRQAPRGGSAKVRWFLQTRQAASP